VHQFVGNYCIDAIVEGWTTVEEKWNGDELSHKVLEQWYFIETLLLLLLYFELSRVFV
jgi:hypothetical protein